MAGELSFHPVRRSALESLHAKSGARWKSDAVRWPLDYGDPGRERALIRESSGIADWGPADKLSVQGPDVASALGKSGLAFRLGEVTENLIGRAKVEVWALSPDEALLISIQAIGLSDYLDSRDIANIPVSSASCLIRVVGPKARVVLGEVCPLDLSDAALGAGKLAHVPVANVRVTLGRQDVDGLPGFTILVPRDYAAYLWQAVLENGHAHALSPVGAQAFEQA
ncbi:MAG: hypothetical protein HY678_08325 [Chloroflexi bacterium]|nr:hypothetical protein [Chloroflexota bacterium]